MMQKKPVAPPQPLFRAPPMSAERVEKLIEQINAGKFAQAELINLYDNAQERELPLVMEAVVTRMRDQFPAAARKKFGAVEKPEKAPKAEKAEKAAKTEEV